MPVTNTLVATWVDYAAASHVLDGSSNVRAVLGSQGLWLPPMVPIEQKVPLAPGARLRYVQTDVRGLLLPLLITGSSYSNRWINQRAAMTWFDPTQPRGVATAVPWDGNGQLQLAAPDGSTRVLNCYCADGLEMLEDDQNSGALWQYAVAALRATDPYWYDSAATVGSPFNLTFVSGKTLSGGQTVTNAGDVESWPIWTVAYVIAASSPSGTLNMNIHNSTTGYDISLTGIPIAATGGASVAHTLVIDTRPTVKTITDNGVNVFANLVLPGSMLFPLAPGSNTMSYTWTLVTANYTTPTQSVQCTRTNAYNSP